MSEQEKAFWEIWDKIEPHFKSYNHRQMFDFGYRAAEEQIVKSLEELFDKAENAETRRLLTMGIERIKGENK